MANYATLHEVGVILSDIILIKMKIKVAYVYFLQKTFLGNVSVTKVM